MNIMLLLFHTTRLQRPDWPAEVHLHDDNIVHFLPVWGTILPAAIPTIVGNQEATHY